MRYIASVSFGKDSLAMLLRLIDEKKPLDEVVFYDTGMEFQAIYNIRDKVKSLLLEKDIKDYENENFLTILNYVETTEPDYIAKDIEQKDKRIAELEKELTELKENAIVPKFNFGDTIFAVVIYIADPKDKTVIESGIVQKIECDKNQIKYWCDNGRIYWEDECEKLFATKAEAEKALKELK